MTTNTATVYMPEANMKKTFKTDYYDVILYSSSGLLIWKNFMCAASQPSYSIANNVDLGKKLSIRLLCYVHKLNYLIYLNKNNNKKGNSNANLQRQLTAHIFNSSSQHVNRH